MVSVSLVVGPKGQVVIPKLLRESYGVRPGSKVVIKEEGDKLVIQKPPEDLLKLVEEIRRKIGKFDTHPHAAYREELEKRHRRAIH
ncbi:AbrB/MazE/SpoVT family DNA-binding domain-containing protein [archaeon]|nr:AbrB/MazE/SpoVT family DNA-binding domain-containing protein [archaeon]